MAWSRIPFRMLEAYLVARLLQSPYFHRFVRRIHGRVQELRDPAYRAAARAAREQDQKDATGLKLYMQLFREEFRNSEWGRLFRRR
ncbi:hypothetical protein TWF106_004336 [Orbilia oligospora]|uniref:Uncharacterized protein n=1 Tax=Orbilia oligospora TaxID=2813651 RepID=A0A6G1MN79_ORBOL|nr:hypothetical protein TWF679_004748 [Orbilia oligospora]KAF3216241.1 hypothetical protein TWF191_009070 [Orbilia oligospora]KAF3229419.1 hypothetical protein TWF106_004336 [Orbilia oligospora]KAF3264451.1 hypothetical protein TWF192_004133 [Orbilia oligospora]